MVSCSITTMPLECLFSNPLPTIPRSKSVLSRFTTPIANRNRNITDFSIEPDHPWKVYSPGDSVKGHVVFTVAKGFDITHLVTCLHGYAKVYNNSVASGDGGLTNDILDFKGGNQGV